MLSLSPASVRSAARRLGVSFARADDHTEFSLELSALVTLVDGFVQGKAVKRDVRLTSGAVVRKTEGARLLHVPVPVPVPVPALVSR